MVAIAVLVVVALFTMNPTAAGTRVADGPSLPAHSIEAALAADGYTVRLQIDETGEHKAHSIEASLSNVAPGAQPSRIFIIGVHSSGTAAALALARLLKDMRPSLGTELKFVFFEDAPDTGNFIAFVGSPAGSRQVQDALSAFRAVSDLPAHGLATPAYVQGVTLSGRAACERPCHAAVMVTDTAFTRYPYLPAAKHGPDTADDDVARVVRGLARTIETLAGARRG